MYFVTFNTLVVIKMALWADSTRRHRIQWGMFIKDVWSLDVSIGCLSPECRAAPCPRAACWLPTAVTTLHSPRPGTRHSARRPAVTSSLGPGETRSRIELQTRVRLILVERAFTFTIISLLGHLNGCPSLVTFATASWFDFTSTFNACLCLA